jgi:PAS domain S-box-containing protein
MSEMVTDWQEDINSPLFLEDNCIEELLNSLDVDSLSSSATADNISLAQLPPLEAKDIAIIPTEEKVDSSHEMGLLNEISMRRMERSKLLKQLSQYSREQEVMLIADRDLESSNNMGILVADAQNRVLLMNDVLRGKLGYDQSEVRSLRYEDVIHPHDYAVVMSWCYNNMISKKRCAHGNNMRLIKKNGDPKNEADTVTVKYLVIWYWYDDSCGHNNKVISDAHMFFE